MNELLILVDRIVELGYGNAYTDVVRMELPEMLNSQEFLVGLDIISSHYEGKYSYVLTHFQTVILEQLRDTAVYTKLLNALEKRVTGDYEYMKRLALVQARDCVRLLDGLVTSEQRLYNESLVENDLHWVESDLCSFSEGNKGRVYTTLFNAVPDCRLLGTRRTVGEEYHYLYSELKNQALVLHIYDRGEWGYAGELHIAIGGDENQYAQSTTVSSFTESV